MKEEMVMIPIHLLSLSYIGDIAGKPVFAKETDAEVARRGLDKLKEVVKTPVLTEGD